MSKLRHALAKAILKAASKEGLNSTPVPGVYCIKISKMDDLTESQWLRSVVIVAQGRKEILLEERVPEYDDAHYIASPLDLVVTSPN